MNDILENWIWFYAFCVVFVAGDKMALRLPHRKTLAMRYVVAGWAEPSRRWVR